MDGNQSLWLAGILDEAQCESPTLCNEATTGGRKNIPCFWLAQTAPIAVLVDCKYSKSASWHPSHNPQAEKVMGQNQRSYQIGEVSAEKCSVTKLWKVGTR